MGLSMTYLWSNTFLTISKVQKKGNGLEDVHQERSVILVLTHVAIRENNPSWEVILCIPKPVYDFHLKFNS